MIHFLVNGDQQIGSGHFRRCLSLAIELRRAGHDVAFFSWSLDPDLENTLRAGDYPVYSIDGENVFELPAYFASLQVSFLIIDSDDRRLSGARWQQDLRSHDICFMFITVDDSAYYYADFVLNQSILALSQNYRGEPSTTFLLGPEYFVFAENFRSKRIEPVKDVGRNVFVGFGAADPAGYTSQVLAAASADTSLNSYTFWVVVGSLNPQWGVIEEICRNSCLTINLYRDVRDLAPVYAACDVSLCSAGLMFWELSLFGVQAMIFAGSSREMQSAKLLNELGYATLALQYGEQFAYSSVADTLKATPVVAPKLRELQRLINPNGIERIVAEVSRFIEERGQE